jgi:Xaa-Pro aminopeptidase
MTRPDFAAFEASEHAERLARARRALSAAGLDGCVCVAPENLFYLAGFDSITFFSQQALVFGAREESPPTLVVRDVDLPLVRETSWLRDIRTYHLHADNVAALVAEVAKERGLATGRVGLELQSFALPGNYALALMEALRPANVLDSTELLNRLQYIKSTPEMDYVREAARYANIGIETAKDALRAGITEIELCAEVEYAMRKAGSDYPAIPTECASGPRSAGGHATAMPRTVGQGELVHLEFAGVARRYHSVSMITMAVGDPGKQGRRIYDLGIESYRAGLARCKPGAAVAEIEEASLEPLRRENLAHTAMMRFGLGIGIGYSPAWVGTFQIDRFSDKRLAPGMVIYMHSCIELVDDRLGIIQGGSYYVGEGGLEPLSGAADCDLYTAR